MFAEENDQQKRKNALLTGQEKFQLDRGFLCLGI